MRRGPEGEGEGEEGEDLEKKRRTAGAA